MLCRKLMMKSSSGILGGNSDTLVLLVPRRLKDIVGAVRLDGYAVTFEFVEVVKKFGSGGFSVNSAAKERNVANREIH